MNKENIELLKSMNKTQYYQFIKNCLGMTEFLNKSDVDVLGEVKPSKEEKVNGIKLDRRKYPKELAFFKQNGKHICTFLVNEEDFSKHTFRDDKGNVFDTKNYFDALGDSLIWMLMTGICGFNKDEIKNYKNHDFMARTIYRIPKSKTLSNCNFILGAGVNYDYNIGDWDTLINNIEKEIQTKIGSSQIDLEYFKRQLCNTNYISPQILKDYDDKTYKSIIYDTLYNSGFNITNTDKTMTPLITETNLYQVARIASSQSKMTKILTFNYDDVLENVFKNSFPNVNYSCVYRNSRTPKYIPDVEIIHTHGFMPMNSPKRNSYSIVFSSFEYMEAYKAAGLFTRKKLVEQLKQTNLIVGNSLSDYEEQKVLYANHRKFLSHYDYILTRCRKEPWMDMYATIYFLKMGVIPVFFSDFPSMNAFLKGL